MLHGIKDLDFVKHCFDAVQPNLWLDLFSKHVLEESVYLKLVREADGEEYNSDQFVKLNDFKFIPIVPYNPVTQPENIPEFLLHYCVPFHVTMQ